MELLNLCSIFAIHIKRYKIMLYHFELIQSAYLIKRNRIQAKQDKVERLEAQIRKLQDKTHWTDDLIRPVMEQVKHLFPDLTWDDEKLIPMGMSAKVSVFSRLKDLPNDENLISLVFSPGIDADLHMETGDNDGTFPNGSLGQVNGLNNITVKIKSIDQVCDRVSEQIKELRAKANQG